MNDIEKFKRHIGRPIPFKVTNDDNVEDEFEFKPLTIEQFAEFVLISEELDKNPNKIMAKELLEFYKSIVKYSYPEVPDDVIDSFIVRNFAELVSLLEKMVPMKMNDEQKQKIQKRLEQIRKAHEQS